MNVQSLVSVVLVSGFMAACSTHPVLPTAADVKVSRDDAGKNCKEIGPVVGKTIKVTSTTEEALEDMKGEAVKKGANYVRMETIGAMGGSVKGTAYYCP